MPLMMNKLRIACFLLLLSPSVFCFSQQNSPWKKLSNQTISNVYFGLGRHQYSLTNGQGFSVYLKNYGTSTAVVSGKVVAKTTCGGEVTTSFITTLAPNQESSGGNFADSTNSQTGVVTPDQCAGVKHYVSAKLAVINRIADVTLRDVQVQTSGATLTPPPIQTTVTQPVTVTTPPVVTPQYALPSNSKYTQDSLQLIIDFLKKRNLDLQDSIVNLKANGYGTGIRRDSVLINIPEKKKVHYKVMYTTPYAGLGWESIPMNINQDNVSPSTSTGNTSHPIILAGANLSFLKQYPVSLQLDPFATYGVDLASSTCGNHLALGGLLRVLAGLKPEAPINLFAEGGLIYRYGNWSKNLTVANPLVAGSYVKTNQSAGYEYNIFRIGGGLQYQWNHGLSYIRPGIFFEDPSIVGSSSVILNIDGQINRSWKWGISYGDNYFTAGKINHPLTYNNESQTYFNLRLCYNIKTF